MATPRYIDEPVQLPEPVTIEQANKNIAYISNLKAQGIIDLDFANSLIADNTTIANNLIAEDTSASACRCQLPLLRIVTHMALDPRLPTIEEVLTGSPFDIIDTPLGTMERWRASTLATGTMGMFQNVYDAVRSDSAALAARADENEARNALIEHLCAKVAGFEQRFNDHEARLAAAEDKRRADEAREAAFNEEPLELPPEPDDPAAQDANTHEPSGDLHTLAAKEEPPEPLAEDEELPSELPQHVE